MKDFFILWGAVVVLTMFIWSIAVGFSYLDGLVSKTYPHAGKVILFLFLTLLFASVLSFLPE
jgi:hypothetical protein